MINRDRFEKKNKINRYHDLAYFEQNGWIICQSNLFYNDNEEQNGI